MNLYRRKIIDDSLCSVCGIEEETVLHVLWTCPASVDVWCVGDKKVQKLSLNGMDFPQIVTTILGKCNTEEVQPFVGLARKI